MWKITSNTLYTSLAHVLYFSNRNSRWRCYHTNQWHTCTGLNATGSTAWDPRVGQERQALCERVKPNVSNDRHWLEHCSRKEKKCEFHLIFSFLSMLFSTWFARCHFFSNEDNESDDENFTECWFKPCKFHRFWFSMSIVKIQFSLSRLYLVHRTITGFHSTEFFSSHLFRQKHSIETWTGTDGMGEATKAETRSKKSKTFRWRNWFFNLSHSFLIHPSNPHSELVKFIKDFLGMTNDDPFISE